MKKAIHYFEQAIKDDPNYAMAIRRLGPYLPLARIGYRP